MIRQILKDAPLLGAGLAFLLIALAIASNTLRNWYHVRIEAIKRADAHDLPSLVGDELDKLGLKADGLSETNTFELVKAALGQRERRNRRNFQLLLVISLLVFVLAIVGMMQSRLQTSGPVSRIASAAPVQNVQPQFMPMRGSIKLTSAPGDYIGGGNDQTFTNTNGLLTASTTKNSVAINFRGDDNWSLTFDAPEGKELTVGTYESAQRAPFHNPVKPGLEIEGAGRGCNTLSGRFEITALERTPDDRLSTFKASFEQFCESSTAPLRGSIDISRALGSP